MDDSLCVRYFLEPDETLHRRYEALRAYFVQRRPLQEIAAQFGYTSGTLRQVIHEFRMHCRSGTPPLVSPPRDTGVPPKSSRLHPTHRRSPIADI